jgi:hypothetical protein
MSVATIQLALARKVKTLAAAWNSVCRGEGKDDRPPLIVGLVGVPNSTHRATGANTNSFVATRLVSTTCLFSYFKVSKKTYRFFLPVCFSDV